MNEKTLLLKLGRRFKTKTKRYCFYQGLGVFLYYTSPSSVKPKGCFKLEKQAFSYKEIPSILKNHEFCIEITIINKIFWLFPVSSKENQSYLNLLKMLWQEKQEKPLIITKKINDLTPRLQTKKNPLGIHKKSRSMDVSALHESTNNIEVNEKSIELIQNPLQEQGLLEEEPEISEDLEDFKRFLCEDILCEGHIPSDIKEISCILQNKSHGDLFSQVLKDEKKQVLPGKPGLLVIPEPDGFQTKKEGNFKQNKTMFHQYQKEKTAFSQHFVFPKREDIFNITPIKNLEIDKEFLLKLGQQFLWEFQLENAAKVFSLHHEDLEFRQGFIEIEIMKILISGKRNLILSLFEKLQIQRHFIENVDTTTPKFEKFLLISEISLIKGLMFILIQNKFQAFLALKDAYSNLKKTETLLKKGCVLENNGFSRYLFITGTFEIGLSLLPVQFRKILEILGVNTNKIEGIENLKNCILQNRNRSNYARTILSLYYIENSTNTSFDEAFSLIKNALSVLSKSPLINWLAALFSWRFLLGNESTKLILRSLSNIGGDLAKEAYYLKFELGWFEMSRCQWLSALTFFEELAIVSLDLFNFDEKCFCDLNKFYKDNNDLLPVSFKALISRAKNMENCILDDYPFKDSASKNKSSKKNTIILPHRNTLALIISICYINLNEDKLCDLWLYMIQYCDKKFSGDSLRTFLDEDVSRLAKKYINRSFKFFLKYEVLYFLKEISKLKDAYLVQMKSNIEVFFQETFKLSLSDHKNIILIIKKNPLEKDLLCEYVSGLFLMIVILCLLRKLEEVMCFGQMLKEIKDFVPKECEYLLHHAFHWVGRAKLTMIEEEGKENKALEYLRLSKKYQDCEFTLKNKNNKAISEILVILSKK